jgi:hypothetical protein
VIWEARIRPLAAAVLTGGLCLVVASAGRTSARKASPVNDLGNLPSKDAVFSFDAHRGELKVTQGRGKAPLTFSLSHVIDGAVRPLEFAKASVRASGDSLVAEMNVQDADTTRRVRVAFRVDRGNDALWVRAESVSGAPAPLRLRADALVAEAGFVSGVGEIHDQATAVGRVAMFEHPGGVVAVAAGRADVLATVEPASGGFHWSMTSGEAAGGPSVQDEARPAELVFSTGPNASRAWTTTFATLGEATARVAGRVVGAKRRVHVWGLDEDGHARIRATVEPQQRFSFEAPKSVTNWYAAVESRETSAPVRFVPGTPFDMRLDVAPSGELRVRVTDQDTGKPLLARLIVHGIDGTLDPSFGPDYRASGAGPLMDLAQGEVTTPLPQGRYRVAATKGIEWSIDAATIDVGQGPPKTVELALRHVVPTPRMVGCDVHVHARPSFDSPVQPEDRVLSLLSAGVDFAVPTEHNQIGDYSKAKEALGVTHDLGSVTGVEVTTYSPKLGHFGVFPYPKNAGLPPFKGTTVAQVFALSRRGDSSRVVQVNHPRLPNGNGDFQLFGFDPKVSRGGGIRLDFDTIEVYNGFDLPERERVETILEDFYALLNHGHHFAATGSSDSHRIQFQWAGYPRTMAIVDDAQGKSGGDVDTAQVVSAIKHGRSSVTSGPIIELSSVGRDKGPGDELEVSGNELRLHVRVLAPPWIDASEVEIIVQGKRVLRRSIAPRALGLGREEGSLADSEARSVRLEEDIAVPLAPGATWVMALVRGERRMDEILPFMPIRPLGFTNPIWLKRLP